jgi:hypothetical protein
LRATGARRIAELRREVIELLDRRPLDGARLFFAGLATPPESTGRGAGPVVLSPRAGRAQDSGHRFEMSLALAWVQAGTPYKLLDFYVETPPADLRKELPGRVLEALASRLFGISNETTWLDQRLTRHERQRTVRRRRTEELHGILRLYEGAAGQVSPPVP